MATNKNGGQEEIKAGATQEADKKSSKISFESKKNVLREDSAEEDYAKKDKLKIKSWYANRYQMVIVQRNLLILFTTVSMIAVAVAVIFVNKIMSSKSLEPYVIEVEQKTGVPVVVEQMSAKSFTGDEMIRKYFINKYIQSSTGYDPKNYKMNAEEVRLFSTPRVYSDFKNRINAKELGTDSTINVRIKSVQFPNTNTAQIRIARQINKDGSESETKDEVITINFYFADLSLTLEERFINPLGFQVSSYIISEEIFNY